MPATPSADKKAKSTLFAFTPRQVLLTNPTMKQSSSNVKLLLHQSIARYLKRTGFSKTLKKFRSEAQIEKDNLEGSSIDLEEMCLKYLEICGKDAKSNINVQKEQVAGVHSKNKEEGKSKEKKKKKSKLGSESLANVEDNYQESQTMATEKKGKDGVYADAKIVNGAETEKRFKDKKKKKDKISSQGDAIEQMGDLNETVLKKDNIKESNKEVTDEEKKDTKKRKRPTSEENGQQGTDKKADEDPKRRRIENLNESEGGEQMAKTSVNLGSCSNSNKENVVASGQVGGDQLQKKSNGQTNGHLESAGEKLSAQKSEKQQKESVEQKSAKKAFQRVQVDKLEFADERLQDNSYWAKDGAENGYGAKAEEILSQVRGRDFRHEKTKKKRGTYRGGQIDLQSHSIKFNYSDDD